MEQRKVKYLIKAMEEFNIERGSYNDRRLYFKTIN